MPEKNVGTLVVITGCKYAGKTEHLFLRMRKEYFARKVIQLFIPRIATPLKDVPKVDPVLIEVNQPEQILRQLGETTNMVFIDDVQFFTEKIVEVVKTLLKQGVTVFCAGLNLDFKGDPFGAVPILMALADEVQSLNAICTVCGEKATMTQRLILGKPATRTSPIIMLGDTVAYEARCRQHHVVVEPS